MKWQGKTAQRRAYRFLKFTTVMLDNGSAWKHGHCHLHENGAGVDSETSVLLCVLCIKNLCCSTDSHHLTCVFYSFPTSVSSNVLTFLHGAM